MENTDIRKKLMEAKKGDNLVLSGGKLLITAVADYKMTTAEWRDIIIGQVAFEINEGPVVRVWRKIDLPSPVHIRDKFIFINDQKLEWEEAGFPRVVLNESSDDITSLMAGKVYYAVYVGALGLVVCLEWWPGEKPEAYRLVGKIPLSDFDIISK